MRAVPESARGVFFTPVDLPSISPSTIAALAAEAGRAPIVVPRCGGRRGHPALVSMEIAREILALPESAQARDVVERHSAEVLYVDVSDLGILADIDEPRDYERLTEGAAR